MTIRPLFDRYLVQKEDFQETAGGLIVSDNQENSQVLRVKVLAKGGECKLNIRPGTQVIIGKHSGITLDTNAFMRIGFNEEDAKLTKMVIREQDILLVIE